MPGVHKPDGMPMHIRDGNLAKRILHSDFIKSRIPARSVKLIISR